MERPQLSIVCPLSVVNMWRIQIAIYWRVPLASIMHDPRSWDSTGEDLNSLERCCLLNTRLYNADRLPFGVQLG